MSKILSKIIGSALFVTLVLATSAGFAQNNNIGVGATMSTKAQWCLKNGGGGPANCTFASKADCMKAARPEGDDCILNPKSKTTTGSGSNSRK